MCILSNKSNHFDCGVNFFHGQVIASSLIPKITKLHYLSQIFRKKKLCFLMHVTYLAIDGSDLHNSPNVGTFVYF